MLPLCYVKLTPPCMRWKYGVGGCRNRTRPLSGSFTVLKTASGTSHAPSKALQRATEHPRVLRRLRHGNPKRPGLETERASVETTTVFERDVRPEDQDAIRFRRSLSRHNLHLLPGSSCRPPLTASSSQKPEVSVARYTHKVASLRYDFNNNLFMVITSRDYELE